MASGRPPQFADSATRSVVFVAAPCRLLGSELVLIAARDSAVRFCAMHRR